MKYTDPKLVSTQDIRQQTVANLVRLIRKLESGGDPSDGLAEVHQLLESLPMATGEFGLAINRLKNARRYLQSCERGAARWELASLLDGLRREIDAASVEPRLRKRRSDTSSSSIELDEAGEAPPAVFRWFILLLIIDVFMAFIWL
ncbi:MAG: hypothetical protein O3C40_12450 [Planctomycetota bacterium]|nr:hypothetical protein [Planctomycetota bacterium]